MSLFADLLTTVFERRRWLRKPGAIDDDSTAIELARKLVDSGSEKSIETLADALLARYEAGDDDAKTAFFRAIATAMDIDHDATRAALEQYARVPSGKSYRAFTRATAPQRAEVISRLNRVPGATERLVRMRADLLRLGGDEPELQALDLDFRRLFELWFNRGFLVLRPVSWESPAHILEKIISYEAVHAITSWDDLRRRLEPDDRRCFAFFHPAMPDEPLIFVEVALVRGIPESVQKLLATGRSPLTAEDAETAVFYSISNCQTGLAGISFGPSLIKLVVDELSRELPNLGTFVTLSPIPRLMEWLSIQPHAGDVAPMTELAAHYLLDAKTDNGRHFDPVARFHLGNGASVHAIHADADTSERGIRQSGGVMVNYLYDDSTLDENYENFAVENRIAASKTVQGLAKTARSAIGDNGKDG